MKKVLFAGAAVALLAAGCSSQTASNTQVQTPLAQTQNTPTNDATAQTPPAAMPVTAPAPAAMASDNSNASLNSSLSGIDSQMNNLSSDSASADSAMSAQTAP